MTNPSTISNLPPASTPYSGSEYVPLVQNGITVRGTIGSIVTVVGVNSVAAGNGISTSTTSGVATVSLSVPVSSANGGTGATTGTTRHADLRRFGRRPARGLITSRTCRPGGVRERNRQRDNTRTDSQRDRERTNTAYIPARNTCHRKSHSRIYPPGTRDGTHNLPGFGIAVHGPLSSMGAWARGDT